MNLGKVITNEQEKFYIQLLNERIYILNKKYFDDIKPNYLMRLDLNYFER